MRGGLVAQAYYSNRLEQLTLFLKEQLFSSETKKCTQKISPPLKLFERRLLIVPSSAMQRHIMLSLAADETLQVATGVECIHLSQAIRRLSGEKRGLSRSALALRVEKELRTQLTSAEIQACPLLHYLKGKRYDGGSLAPRRKEERLLSLSDRLAELFSLYSLYAQDYVEKWKEAPRKNWQEALWQDIFGPNSEAVDEGRLMRELSAQPPKLPETLSIHVFGFSFLPRIILDFLLALSKQRPLHFYFLSPCQAFWTDIKSDQESWRLQEYWRKAEVGMAEQHDLAAFLADRNPLLANFGRLGREMTLYLEEAEVKTVEAYHLPVIIAQLPQYKEAVAEDLFLSPSSAPPTILQAIQADLLLLRNPKNHEEEKIRVSPDDKSVQVHRFSSRYREVQGLYDLLLHTIDAHHDDERPIYPGDIIVTAPNIADYEPYIEAIFGAESSLLPYRLVDVPLQTQGSLAQGLLNLLDLAQGRWDLSTVYQVLDHEDFQRSQDLSVEDVNRWKQWLRSVKVTWGLDPSHRKTQLLEAHCSRGPVDASPNGTWSGAFQRLLRSLCVHETEESSLEEVDTLPGGSVEMTEACHLGDLIELITSLHADLDFISPGRHLPFSEWVDYLRCLMESYFAIDLEDRGSQNEWKLLQGIFSHLKGLATNLKGEPVPFASVEHRLRAELRSHTGSRHEHKIQAVNFCALLPMRAIPAEVLVFMGLDDASYPRQEDSQSLNLMTEWKECDYCPTRVDFDRYLFLEALLSARRHLFISFQGHVEDKEVLPSLLVQELLDYITKFFRLEKQDVPPQCLVSHPFEAQHPDYFSNKSTLPPCFNELYFKMATAAQQGVRPPHRFLTPLLRQTQPIQLTEEGCIDVADLGTLARNPLKFYFQKALELHLPSPEKQEEGEEYFHLSHLVRAQLRREALYCSSAANRAELQGLFPPGLFGHLAKAKLEEECAVQEAALREWGIDSQTLFQWDLHPSCSQPTKLEEKRWRLPSPCVELEGKRYWLTGTLAPLSSQGLLSLGKDSFSDVIKLWPKYLAFLLASRSLEEQLGKQLLLLRSGKQLPVPHLDPEKELQRYLRYFFRCQKEPSPLLPEWLASFLKKDVRFLAKDVKSAWSEPWNPFYNHYAIWAFDSSASLSMEALFQGWKHEAESLFLPMAMEWKLLTMRKKTS